MKRLFILFLRIGLLAGLCWVSYRFGRSRQVEVGDPVVGAVNGLPIRQGELDGQMLLFRERAMKQLVELRLLEREATRIGLQVPDKGPQPGLQTRAQAQQERAQALLRAIILKEAGELEIRNVYETCREELYRYDVSVILFKDQLDQEAGREKLSSMEFAQVARGYSQDERSRGKGGRLSWVTAPQVKERYGSEVAQEVSLLQPGQVSGPVAAPFGVMILKVHARELGFEQLRESAENVLVYGRTTPLLYDLNQEAVLTVP